MQKRAASFLIVTTILLAWSLPGLAQALSIETVGGTLGLGSADLKTTTVNIIQWVLGLLGLIAVAMIIIGSIVAATSADSDRGDAARKTILAAIIGLIIILISWAIVTFVIGTTTNVTS
ncbi:MAG: hypothetical protein AAB515_01845 [Patescibacteria group bacterium]